MSYEPTNWKTGDVVTSAKLNKLENAVANGGALKLNFTIDNEAGTITLDRTFSEIKEAVLSGVNVFGILPHSSIHYIVHPVYFDEGTEGTGPDESEFYVVGINSSANTSGSPHTLEFAADNVNNYLVCDIKNS